MPKPVVIDADGHILEPPDLWQRYLEPAYRDRAIRLAVDERGLEYLEIDRHKSRLLQGGTLGILGGAYQDPRELMTPGKVSYWEAAKRTPGGIDPDARVREMDEQGIDMAILYPTIGICWEGECDDPQLSAAYCRAYNNYVLDFCSGHADRLIPIAQINLRDVNLAIAEVERVKDKVKGLFYTPFPTNGIPIGAAYYDPFWACVEASGLPISTHVQVRPDFLGDGLYRHTSMPRAEENSMWYIFMQITEDSRLGLNCLFQGGVLERFPRLRYVVLEIGCGWLPAWMERADAKYEAFSFSTAMHHTPSQLFRNNCWISADVDEAMIPEVSKWIGAERMLWATDYPHLDAHKDPLVELRTHLGGLSSTDQEWILGRAAAELYRL